MKPTKCMCRELEKDIPLKYDILNRNYIIDYAGADSERWETLFFPEPDYNCGETIDIYDDTCISTEHWSNREEGQHNVIGTLCHFCVIERKKHRPYVVEYSKVKWQ